MAGKAGRLTAKQQLFCEEYIIDLNATQAAIRAGYSEKTAYSIGPENLGKPEIQEHIQSLMDERSNRNEITADRVLQEIAKLAFGNIENLYDESGKLLPPHKLTTDVAATVTEVTSKIITSDLDDAEENVLLEWKYKIADKGQNLERLGRHLRLFTDKTEHTGANGGPIETSIKVSFE